jgi:hypothetical protein
MNTYSDRLEAAVARCGNAALVGLDPQRLTPKQRRSKHDDPAKDEAHPAETKRRAVSQPRLHRDRIASPKGRKRQCESQRLASEFLMSQPRDIL